MQQRSLLTEQQATGDQGQECLTARMHRSESHVPQSPLVRHLSQAQTKALPTLNPDTTHKPWRIKAFWTHTHYLNARRLANRSLCELEGEVRCPDLQRPWSIGLFERRRLAVHQFSTYTFRSSGSVSAILSQAPASTISLLVWRWRRNGYAGRSKRWASGRCLFILQ